MAIVMREYERLEDKDHLAYAVIQAAYDIFKEAGCLEDFGIQHARLEAGCLIFGGTNRLVFSPERGLRPDRGLCTARFIAVTDKHLGRYA
jgi:hypothetical protein